MQKSRLVLIAFALVTLGACYEPADVAIAEPGVYKGPKDPLLMKSGAEQREQLIARFNQVQRDR